MFARSQTAKCKPPSFVSRWTRAQFVIIPDRLGANSARFEWIGTYIDENRVLNVYATPKFIDADEGRKMERKERSHRGGTTFLFFFSFLR